MKYIFGVMSRKFELESDDLNCAKMAMVLFYKKNIPIAIYSPKEEAFLPKELLLNWKENEIMNDKVKNVYESIKEISNYKVRTRTIKRKEGMK